MRWVRGCEVGKLSPDVVDDVQVAEVELKVKLHPRIDHEAWFLIA